jgi:hypothetical protein
MCEGRGVVRIAEEATPSRPAWISCPECSPDPVDPDAERMVDDGDDWPVNAVVGLNPDHEARLTMADLIALEVDRYRSWRTRLGDLLAAKVAELLAEVERAGARDVSELIDRRCRSKRPQAG